MSQPDLKLLLTRKKDLAGLLRQVIDLAGVYLEDTNGALLLGERPSGATVRLPVVLDKQTLGWVAGDHQVEYNALLINYLLKQEAEKKKIGAETLHLYKEINLIYTFSEKLSAAIGVEAIAQLTLREAGHLIRFTESVVILGKEPAGKLFLAAHTGNDFFQAKMDLQADHFFGQLALTGKSGIIPAPELAGSFKAGQFILYAALKVREKVLGAIFLSRPDAQEFSAADLKLLITLAFQSAAAIESALMYEKTAAKALRAQREEVILEQALKHPFFKKVLTIIQANIANPDFNVERLSRSMNLSSSQLQRKIFALAERRPVQIIRELKLQKARELLRDSDLTVAEIAWQTGFNDPSYFTRLFTREMNATPSEWKAQSGAQ